MLSGVNAMSLVAGAPDRSLYSFSQTYRGPYMQAAFFFTLTGDAFRSFRVPPR
jgi:hypothetical protein